MLISNSRKIRDIDQESSLASTPIRFVAHHVIGCVHIPIIIFLIFIVVNIRPSSDEKKVIIVFQITLSSL